MEAHLHYYMRYVVDVIFLMLIMFMIMIIVRGFHNTRLQLVKPPEVRLVEADLCMEAGYWLSQAVVVVVVVTLCRADTAQGDSYQGPGLGLLYRLAAAQLASPASPSQPAQPSPAKLRPYPILIDC